MSGRREMPSQDELNRLLSYKPETGRLVWKIRGLPKWDGRWAGKPALISVNLNGYLCGEVFARPHRAHRIIWKMVHGLDPDDVDHVDGNRQNNRLINLRSVTRQDNLRNARRRSDNVTGVTGVSWDANRGRWFVSICVDGKTIGVGRFMTLPEAALARKHAEDKFGFHQNHGRD